MQSYLAGRDFITTQEFTKSELDLVFDVAFDLKRKRALGESHALLRDKVLAMLFFFSSTRTRVSFEAGMAQLGMRSLSTAVPRRFLMGTPVKKSARLSDAIATGLRSVSAIGVLGTTTSAAWRNTAAYRF